MHSTPIEFFSLPFCSGLGLTRLLVVINCQKTNKTVIMMSFSFFFDFSSVSFGSGVFTFICFRSIRRGESSAMATATTFLVLQLLPGTTLGAIAANHVDGVRDGDDESKGGDEVEDCLRGEPGISLGRTVCVVCVVAEAVTNA